MLQSWYADYQADKGPTTANAQATGGAAPASAAGGKREKSVRRNG